MLVNVFYLTYNLFLDNEVDIEALQLLDEAQIKTLIPAIGPQAKFKKALDDWNIQKVSYFSITLTLTSLT